LMSMYKFMSDLINSPNRRKKKKIILILLKKKSLNL